MDQCDALLKLVWPSQTSLCVDVLTETLGLGSMWPLYSDHRLFPALCEFSVRYSDFLPLLSPPLPHRSGLDASFSHAHLSSQFPNGDVGIQWPLLPFNYFCFIFVFIFAF